MKYLLIGIKLQKYLLFLLLIGFALSLERYFIGVIPFTDSYIIPSIIMVYFSCSLILYICVVILILFQTLKKVFFVSDISSKKFFIKYSIGILIWLCSLPFFFYLLTHHKVEIINNAKENITNIRISTSFTSQIDDKMAGMNLGNIEKNNSKVWELINLEDHPYSMFKREITLKYNISNDQKQLQKRTSLFRTKFIIDNNAKLNINCETQLNYIEINNKPILTTTINLCQSLLKNYTIDIERFDDSNSSFLIINTPKQYKIKKVERIIYWYPSIWSPPEDNLIQYLKLSDLLFQTTENLRILNTRETEDEILSNETYNNVFFYSDIDQKKYDLNFFSNLEKDKILKSIKSKLNTPKESYTNYSNSQNERGKWLNYLEKYSKGDFLNISNEMFSTDYFDIYLKITFEGESADYVRVLHQVRNIGN